MQYSDLFSPIKIKRTLEQAKALPKRSLGQNFLIDKNTLEKILRRVQISKTDTVIEVGAGLGLFTVPLAQASKQVIAYEIDKRLISILQTIALKYSNVEIKNQDILKKVKNQKSKIKNNYIVFGNLPYYIAARIIRQFLSAKKKPKQMIIIVQKEVGARMCKKPGEMSLLSVSVQYYGVPKILMNIAKTCFWPKPNVNSALVEIIAHKKEFLTRDQDSAFFVLVKQGFSSKRKMLINNLKKSYSPQILQQAFAKTNLPAKIRAQELGVSQWVGLYRELICKQKSI